MRTLLCVFGYFVIGFIVSSVIDVYEGRVKNIGIILDSFFFWFSACFWPITGSWFFLAIFSNYIKPGKVFSYYRKFLRGELKRTKNKKEISA